MNKILDELAIKYVNYKFLKFNITDNEIAIDRVTLPILQFYKNGESVHVSAGFEHEFGRNFSVDDVDW